MYIRAFYAILALILIPISVVSAGLELSFSDTSPPSPLTNDVLPVGGGFSIDVIATAPVGTVAAVDFSVIWMPMSNVDYISVGAGGFLPGAIVVGADSNAPGSQTIGVATGSGGNTVESGVLVTLSFIKQVGEGSVRFDFGGISALDMQFQPVTPVSGIPSSDITLPVVFSSLSAEISQIGVTIRWHTTHEIDNAGFNVLRSSSRVGGYTRLNRDLIEGQGTSAIPQDYYYIDNGVTAGNTYFYRVEALDLSGEKSSSKVIRLEVTEDALNPPGQSELGQNYPNPGNPETWIPYILASDGETRIEIYDMAGRMIRRLDLGHKDPGRYILKDKAAYWDGRNSSGEEVPSGIYFYTIKAGSFFVRTRKLVMLK